VVSEPALKVKCWAAVQAAVWPLTGQAPKMSLSLKLSPSARVSVTAMSWARSGPLLPTVNCTVTSLPGVCVPAGPLSAADRLALDGGGGGGVWIWMLLLLLLVSGSAVALLKLPLIVWSPVASAGMWTLTLVVVSEP